MLQGFSLSVKYIAYGCNSVTVGVNDLMILALIVKVYNYSCADFTVFTPALSLTHTYIRAVSSLGCLCPLFTLVSALLSASSLCLSHTEDLDWT